MKKLAEIVRKNFPRAADVLENNLFIDDALFSCKSIQEARETIEETITCAKTAHFEMHKIASNCESALANIENHRLLSHVDKKPKTGVLGLNWEMEKDLIMVDTSLSIPKLITKRSVLSTLAQIYDPLGHLSCCTMIGKLLLQKIWVSHSTLNKIELLKSWDEPLPESIQQEFLEWINDLKASSGYAHPRNLGFDLNKNQQIIIFCDASERAYGAVAYLRTIESSKVKFELICSKGRVAPILKNNKTRNHHTIPQLEMLGAVLASELYEKIKKGLSLPNNFPVQIYSDSLIVLGQIKSTTLRGVFFENRLRIIRERTEASWWYFIAGSQNPADLITRGSSLQNMPVMWLAGPEMMRDPNYVPKDSIYGTKYPYAGCTAINCASIKADLTSIVDPEFDFLNNSRSFEKTKRIFAWVMRACDAFRGRKRTLPYQIQTMGERNLQIPPLDLPDLKRTETKLIRIIQGMYYSKEIALLKAKKPILNGPLKTKCVFIDDKFVLRSATRIQHEEFSYDERNPIIGPPFDLKHDREDHMGYQIIYDAHLETKHGGISATIAKIRQKYFFPNLRAAVKRHILKCQLCVRLRAKTRQQIMGNLPIEAVKQNPAFSHVAIDFIGPLRIKRRYKRLPRKAANDDKNAEVYDKAWILNITCLATGAVHLELAWALTTEVVIQVFQNFCNVRGVPVLVRSDNQSSIVKASKMIQDSVLKMCKNQLGEFCASKGMMWKFTPPLGSNFNGKGERINRSVREIMLKVIGNNLLHFEDLYSTLKQIEAQLNSRPLLRARGEFEDGDLIITPGHFIIGRALNSIPQTKTDYKNVTLYEAYKTRLSIEKAFWKMFYQSHLHEIQNRQKWFRPIENFIENDLVILKEENTNPLVWKKALVVKPIKGPDGKVRVVKLRTANGNFTRTLDKIVLLPSIQDVKNSSESRDLGEIPETECEITFPIDKNKIQSANSESLSAEKRSLETINEKEEDTEPRNLKKNVVEIESSKITNDSKTPIKKENVTESVKTPITETTSSRPPRRKAAIKAMKTIPALLLCLLVSSVSSVNGQLKMNGSQNGGIMIYEQEMVFLSEGTFHIEIKSDKVRYTDSSKILHVYHRFANECTLASKSINIHCDSLQQQIRDRAVKSLDLIGERVGKKFNLTTSFDIPKRIIRNTGIFWRFLNWAFGIDFNDTADIPHGESSAGILPHSIEAISDLGKTISNHEKALQQEFQKLKREFNYQEAQGKSLNKNAVESQYHRFADAILFYIDKVMEFYHSNHFLDNEIEAMVNKINFHLINEDAKVIPLPLHELKKLMKVKYVYNETVNIICELPLVSNIHFNKILVIPIPDNNTNTILDVNATSLLINLKEKMFINIDNKFEAIKINSTVSMAKSQIINLVNSESDCLIKLIFDKETLCKSKLVPKSYDFWYDTGLHNVFQFFSNAEKALICPEKRTTVNENFGVVSIPNSCYIRTPNKIIRSIIDKTTIRKQMIKINSNFDNFKTLNPELNVSITKIENLDLNIDTTKLDRLKNEAYEESYYKPALIAISISITIVIITIIIVCSIILYKKLNEKEKEKDIEMRSRTPEPGAAVKSLSGGENVRNA
jgi:hypothetical protein